MKSFRLFCRALPLLLILTAVHSCKADEAPALAAPQPQKLPAPLSVLVVGDSNTEIGHITGETARLMEGDFGYFGSGYHSLHAAVGTGSGYLPGLKISDDGQWQRYEMVPTNTSAPKPFLSPDGTAARGSKTGAVLTVEFYGTGADIYWLAAPENGAFSLALDGGSSQRVETAGSAPETRRTRLEGLKIGWHKLAATVEKGPVTLLGVDARVLAPDARRAVVHKWGKGWATSADFAAIEPRVFTSALELLKPDIVVLLLGTNDHNLVGAGRDQFSANLEIIAARVRAALPAARMVMVSTFQVNSPWSNNGLKQYIEIFPDVATKTGARFWDMSSWFGPWQASNEAGLMQDGVHVNQKGGAKIAEALYPILLETASQPLPTLPAPENLKTVGAPPPNLPVMAGLRAWWNGDAPMQVDAQNRIARWDGPTPATQQWAQKRPLRVENGLNGHAVARFDGKSAYLTFSLLDSIQSVIFVAKANKPGGAILGHPHFNTRPFHPGVKIPAKLLSANYAAPAILQGAAYLNGEAKPVGDDNADAIEMTPGNFQIVSLIAKAPLGAAALGWGGSWNFNRYFDGDFAEILLFDRALDDTERRQIERSLSEKHALPLH